MLKKIIIVVSVILIIGVAFVFYKMLQLNSCPDNYIRYVTHMFGTKNICIAKYEMKKGENGEAISIPKGLPWVNINYSEAVAACKKNGLRYDLITNKLWTTLAREITLVPENWSSGTEFIGRVNSGHVRNEPKGLLPASKSDDEACFQTKERCSSLDWAFSKRTYTLASTEVLWDFSGNAGEWVKEEFNNRGIKKEIAYVELDFKEPPFSRFGPVQKCDNPNQDNRLCGYGYLLVSSVNDPKKKAIIRGGRINQGREVGGIFTATIGVGPEERHPDVGFRCTFLPLKKISLSEIFDEPTILDESDFTLTGPKVRQ